MERRLIQVGIKRLQVRAIIESIDACFSTFTEIYDFKDLFPETPTPFSQAVDGPIAPRSRVRLGPDIIHTFNDQDPATSISDQAIAPPIPAPHRKRAGSTLEGILKRR